VCATLLVTAQGPGELSACGWLGIAVVVVLFSLGSGLRVCSFSVPLE
jgi:hypothetical protein